MPLGPYANFAECLSAMKGKGKSDEAAHKICGWMEHNLKKHAEPDQTYEPPAAGKNAPQEIKDILDTVYTSCRKQNPGESHEAKSKCARIAWSAVRKAGWNKDEKGSWRKSKAHSEPVSWKDLR